MFMIDIQTFFAVTFQKIRICMSIYDTKNNSLCSGSAYCVQKEVQVDEVHAKLLPEEKVRCLKEVRGCTELLRRQNQNKWFGGDDM